MHFDSISAFFMMGKHGFYVWTAYGAFFFLLAALLIYMKLQRAKVITDIERDRRRSLAQAEVESTVNDQLDVKE